MSEQDELEAYNEQLAEQAHHEERTAEDEMDNEGVMALEPPPIPQGEEGTNMSDRAEQLLAQLEEANNRCADLQSVVDTCIAEENAERDRRVTAEAQVQRMAGLLREMREELGDFIRVELQDRVDAELAKVPEGGAK